MVMKVEQKKNKLVITIDTDTQAQEDAPLSGSGKGRLLASSRAGMPIAIDGHVYTLNLNLYCPPEGTPGLVEARRRWSAEQKAKQQVADARG